MARDQSLYAKLLKRLMPTGRAWSRSTGVIPETLTGLAVELARLDSRVDDLILERDARTTTELIDEHEVEWGLPDECLGSSSVLADRRSAVLAKIRAIGGLSPQYYIDVAAALGYTITIVEFTPAWAGIMVAGDPCGDQTQLFYWLVNVHYDFADPFTSFNDLQCLLEKIKPAHTIVLLQMYGPAFSNAFSSAFDAMPTWSTYGAFDSAFSVDFDIFPYIVDRFDDSYLNPDFWLPVVSGAGTVAETTELTLTTLAAGDTAFAYSPIVYDETRGSRISVRAKCTAVTSAMLFLHAQRKATAPVSDTIINQTARRCMECFQLNTGVFWMRYTDNVGITYYWRASTSEWTTTVGATAYTGALNTVYRVELETNGTRWRMAIYDTYEVLLEQTDWVLWTATHSTVDPIWLMFGDIWNDQHFGTLIVYEAKI